ncbi:metallophosphoesterase family protein [Massilia sp. R2A-15]|uniref:metallophosphoesterase family protein n=1 Tax=Massilia sp. R2A-15 TaxID=3064278 RepID=UPI0027360825|nr:metallophosphoesterase family protein [Massilia sp. R2A-15]WLI89579.1 metallophosphoesterase family protein [Massilia sp. R2A-15]
MRLALLTDLHANREALSACLAHAEQQKADQYAFTGDFVGYGADPAWVVDTVMQYVARGAVAVQGNHDYSVTRETRPQMHAEAREVIEWTRGQLNAEQMAFLRELPLTEERGNMLFVHASALDPIKWEYVTGIEEAERSLRATHCKMVFSGHVHKPSLFRRADDGRMGSHTPEPGARIVIRPQHQHLVIPGAVGQPRDGNCSACYALYDDVTRELTYFRVPYDHGAAARRVIASGLPIVFAMRLIEGI